jgi:hypothetical protein
MNQGELVALLVPTDANHPVDQHEADEEAPGRKRADKTADVTRGVRAAPELRKRNPANAVADEVQGIADGLLGVALDIRRIEAHCNGEDTRSGSALSNSCVSGPI